MFECLSCGEKFEVPAVTKETHFELYPPTAESFAACPICKDYDIVKEGENYGKSNM